MKAVILAGGKGTRLGKHFESIPKPMVQIDRYPILLHVMDIYASQGIRDFVILTGHQGHIIREFFFNFWPRFNDFTINLQSGEYKSEFLSQGRDWNVSILDTGEETMTGGRLLRAKNFLKKDSSFFLTYGDGLANIDLKLLLKHHQKKGTIATVTAVSPPGRFGALRVSNGVVQQFMEKPKGDGSFINGGFFVFSNKIFDYIEGDSTILEQEPLLKLVEEGMLSSYEHTGFWQCMDTPRDVELIRKLASNHPYPWFVNESQTIEK